MGGKPKHKQGCLPKDDACESAIKELAGKLSTRLAFEEGMAVRTLKLYCFLDTELTKTYWRHSETSRHYKQLQVHHQTAATIKETVREQWPEAAAKASATPDDHDVGDVADD